MLKYLDKNGNWQLQDFKRDYEVFLEKFHKFTEQSIPAELLEEFKLCFYGNIPYKGRYDVCYSIWKRSLAQLTTTRGDVPSASPILRVPSPICKRVSVRKSMPCALASDLALAILKERDAKNNSKRKKDDLLPSGSSTTSPHSK